MNSSTDRADAYLRELGISADSFSMDSYCNLFLREMQHGLAGRPSSLQMIPTYISTDHEIPLEKPVIVIDAGGTNLRTAVVTFDHTGTASIDRFTKRGMPGVKEEVSARRFFSDIADAVEPIIDASQRIGFCFSYAADITEDRDGRLIVFSKEIKAPEVVGKLVGSELLRELSGRGLREEKRLTLLNDTVATLLAGRAQSIPEHYSGYVGFILGTGTNTSYIEESRNITRITGRPEGEHQVINTESGNFALPAAEADREFFAATKDPDSYHFEKLISGAYLGQYGRFLLKKAAADGMLSEEFSRAFNPHEGRFDTIVMDSFLHNPHDRENLIHSCCLDDDEAGFVYRLLDSVIERAGKLTAVNLAATVLKSNRGSDPRRPVCINADGTTFYKTHNLKRYTQWYLQSFLEREHHRYYEFVHIENSPVLGAAAAGLIG